MKKRFVILSLLGGAILTGTSLISCKKFEGDCAKCVGGKKDGKTYCTSDFDQQELHKKEQKCIDAGGMWED